MPVGIAAIARLIPIRKSESNDWPRQPQHDDEHQCDRGGGGDHHRQLVELLRQRRLLFFGLVQHIGDLPDLRVHPGPGHDHLAPPARHGRVHVRHVEAVAQRHIIACGVVSLVTERSRR